MDKLKIIKHPIIEEDLGLDDTSPVQWRDGKEKWVTPLKLFKIANSLEHLRDVDFNKFEQGIVFGGDPADVGNNTFYKWDGSNNAPEALPDIVTSNLSNEGRWIKQILDSGAPKGDFVTRDTEQEIEAGADKIWRNNNQFHGYSDAGQLTIVKDENSPNAKLSICDTAPDVVLASIGFQDDVTKDLSIENNTIGGKIMINTTLEFKGDRKNINQVAKPVADHQATPKDYVDEADAELQKQIDAHLRTLTQHENSIQNNADSITSVEGRVEANEAEIQEILVELGDKAPLNTTATKEELQKGLDKVKGDANHAFTTHKIFEKGKPITGFENITNNPFFRIPAMCVSPTTGTIFVFSDYRNDPGDQVAIEIACARSTNGGYDWTYSKAVTREGNDAHSRVMDSTCLATQSGKIFVLAGSWSQGTNNWTQGTSRDTHWKAILAVSTNDGVSWTQNTIQFTTQNPLPGDVNAFLGGVGAGVQLRDGRLVFPVQFTRSRGSVSAGMIWSSDDGATWNWTAGSINGMSENMIFEDLEGNLICVGRKDPNNTPKARASFITTDNGATWREYSKLHARIPANGNAGCQGSSIYFVTQNGVPILLMTAAQNRKGGYNRDRITLYASNNSYGAIKEVFVLNYNGGAIERNTPFGGYSCLAYYKGADGERLFCVFEDGLGVRLTDLTPLIAELELLFKPQDEISIIPTIQNRASSYVADDLITEYSANNLHKNIWLENGNWCNLDVHNSRGEVSVDGTMVKFRNSSSSNTNYACSKVSDALHLLTNKEMTLDFDLAVPTSSNLSVSSYQCVFVFNGGGNDVNFSYGLMFHTASNALQMNPVGYWGNSSTFNIPTELIGTKLHFTMVYTATSCNIYLNGNATPVFTKTFTSPGNWLDRVKKVWLGNAPTRDKICDFALGNFKMYGRALTPEEALQNYKASLPIRAEVAIATDTKAGIVKSSENTEQNRGKIKVDPNTGDMDIIKGEEIAYKDEQNLFAENNTFAQDVSVRGNTTTCVLSAGERPADSGAVGMPEDPLLAVYGDVAGAPERLKKRATYNREVDTSGRYPNEIVNVDALQKYVRDHGGGSLPQNIAYKDEQNLFTQKQTFDPSSGLPALSVYSKPVNNEDLIPKGWLGDLDALFRRQKVTDLKGLLEKVFPPPPTPPTKDDFETALWKERVPVKDMMARFKVCPVSLRNMLDPLVHSRFSPITDFTGIEDWDTSQTTDMRNLFGHATTFNGDLSRWDTSNVTNFRSMFSEVSAMFSGVSNWDVSSGVNFYEMFNYASRFNEDISNWNVSSGVNFYRMFRNCVNFNQSLLNWNVSKSTNFSEMFHGANVFNQDISNWNVSSGVNFSVMFAYATAFNQDISGWVLSSATDISYMFNYASAFNQNLEPWGVHLAGRVVDMTDTFTSCPAPVPSWWTSRTIQLERTAKALNIDTTNASDSTMGLLWNVAGIDQFYLQPINDKTRTAYSVEGIEGFNALVKAVNYEIQVKLPEIPFEQISDIVERLETITTEEVTNISYDPTTFKVSFTYTPKVREIHNANKPI